jgi:hypothetical protein
MRTPGSSKSTETPGPVIVSNVRPSESDSAESKFVGRKKNQLGMPYTIKKKVKLILVRVQDWNQVLNN